MSDNWAVQVSVKTKAGTLVNVRADTPEHLDQLLGQVMLRSEVLSSVERQLMEAGGHTQPTQPVHRAKVDQPRADPWTTPQPEAQVPSCPHGPRMWREGTSKAGNPYKMWKCTHPDRAGECDPIYV